MKSSPNKVQALGLCSGGLDSILAGLVLRGQGIAVEWVAFETPFFSSVKARKASRITGIPLTVREITSTYMEMLKNPPCGYGKYMNPCMDCHALMFRLAGEMMKARGFDFLFSGEVLGQRPMSQTRPSLRYVEKHSGFDGLILRPLSAQKLPVTLPEQQGLVDRRQLLDFSGRSRKPQMKLAESMGITEYPTPAGGCLLTDKGYTIRLKDLFDHQTEIAEREYHLLKFGRHFRLDDQVKIVVGRTRKDNEDILRYYLRKRDFLLHTNNFPGPTVLVPGGCGEDKTTLAALICAAYSKAPPLAPVEVSVEAPSGRTGLQVLAMTPADFKHLMI